MRSELSIAGLRITIPKSVKVSADDLAPALAAI